MIFHIICIIYKKGLDPHGVQRPPPQCQDELFQGKFWNFWLLTPKYYKIHNFGFMHDSNQNKTQKVSMGIVQIESELGTYGA